MGWLKDNAFGLLGLGGDILGNIMGSSAQRDANRTNVRLQREQQSWEEKMSGSAVQRRADDIQAAGGNRALAFVGGDAASTPTIAPTRVEPTVRAENFNFTGKALAMQQMANIKAQTELTNAQAKGQTIKNNVENYFALDVAALNLDLLNMKKQSGEKEYELLERQIENAVKTGLNLSETGKNLALTGESTALGNERMQKMTDKLVTLLMQQVRTGEIDLAALENVASVGGVEAGKAAGFTKTVIDALRLFFENRRKR